jgi:hypothetical protein
VLPKREPGSLTAALRESHEIRVVFSARNHKMHMIGHEAVRRKNNALGMGFFEENATHALDRWRAREEAPSPESAHGQGVMEEPAVLEAAQASGAHVDRGA